MQVRKMRLLRQKHRISHLELGRACGLSPQRVSEIELSVEGIAPETEQKLKQGFWRVAEERQIRLTVLRDDLAHCQNSLFEAVEETAYEL